MQRAPTPRRSPSAGQGLTLPDLLLIAALFGSLLLLQGCSTAPSRSACPPLSAPTAITAAVPGPVLAPETELTPEDVLDNAAANGEQANDLRARLLEIQAWARRVGIWF